MTEKERFELTINTNGQVDIIDWVESKKKNAVCIYNDLGVLPFSSANALCDLLNKQERKIKELIVQLKTDDICSKCKHEYLIKQNDGYFIAKCKKEHEECSKEYIRFCEDFESNGDIK